jgi:hypothetical protein
MTETERISVRGMEAKVPEDCEVCGDFTFDDWGIRHGLGYCTCGAPYMLRPLGDEDWDDVPTSMVHPDVLEKAREKYEETGNVRDMDEWLQENYDTTQEELVEDGD